MRIGILAVQGDFEAHATKLEQLNVPHIYVLQPKHLSGVQGLIIPGGESTTMLKFLAEDGFLDVIKDFAAEGRCLFGTCAGAILLAKEVVNPTQTSLNLIDVGIQRNGFGRQLSSHIGRGFFKDESPMEMTFIRAPRIFRIGPGVSIFATYQGEPVGVVSDNYMLTTFHPEMTNDLRVHQLFVNQCTNQH